MRLGEEERGQSSSSPRLWLGSSESGGHETAEYRATSNRAVPAGDDQRVTVYVSGDASNLEVCMPNEEVAYQEIGNAELRDGGTSSASQVPISCRICMHTSLQICGWIDLDKRCVL